MIPPPHPTLGLGVVMLSGILTATFPVPMKLSRAWKWENTWLVYATLALVVIPIGLAAWAVPDLFGFYSSVPARTFLLPLVFGFGWGIAQVTFGISIARVGMAMAFAIVIGLSAVLGSVIPLVAFDPKALSGGRGFLFLVSAVLLVCGLVFYARAGREREMRVVMAGQSGRSFVTGLALCVFTGCFGSMINMGFVFGARIAEQAMLRGISAPRATLSVWTVVLAAGYLPNVGYTLYLLQRNRTAGAFSRSTAREFLLALAAAVLWLFGMLGYGIGASAMGPYGTSIGFALCMAVLLLWSTALGTFAGEWRNAPPRARFRMRLGVAFLAASMLMLGFDSLFQ